MKREKRECDFLIIISSYNNKLKRKKVLEKNEQSTTMIDKFIKVRVLRYIILIGILSFQC